MIQSCLNLPVWCNIVCKNIGAGGGVKTMEMVCRWRENNRNVVSLVVWRFHQEIEYF